VKMNSKFLKLICIIILIISILTNVILYKQNSNLNTEKEGIIWQEHIERIHFFSKLLDQIVDELRLSPVPLNHIDSKLRLATISNTPSGNTWEIKESNDGEYDIDLIIWTIYNEMSILTQSKSNISKEQYDQLANELESLNDSMEEYWIGQSMENKDKSIKGVRIILLEILDEIEEIKKSLSNE